MYVNLWSEHLACDYSLCLCVEKIAFWMACSGKMEDAASHMNVEEPFAGGVVSFALHMNGKTVEAERIARTAMNEGHRDPWAIHAVAHCLYSLGRSKECIRFLDEHRAQVRKSSPSSFMKGHMEFHQALCYIDLEDSENLQKLVEGPLWTTLSVEERSDYWNAVGLLNIYWKAELRGLPSLKEDSLQQAMEIVIAGASASKSPVFSLCVLRWSMGDFRTKWKGQIMKIDNDVLKSMAAAVDLLYPSSDGSNKDSFPRLKVVACTEATERFILSNLDSLHTLGASPEQREVLEEFLAVAIKKSSVSGVDLSAWKQRNIRPHISFYSRLLAESAD